MHFTSIFVTIEMHLKFNMNSHRRKTANDFCFPVLKCSIQILICLLVFINASFADERSFIEVKSAFVYSFTRYIDWPKDDHPKSNFVINILDKTPGLIEEFDKLSDKKLVSDRKIKIIHSNDLSQIKTSDVVVFSQSEDLSLREVQKRIKGSNVLLITQEEASSGKGLMINFYLDDGKLRFEMNRKLLEAQNFKVSAQLLKLAKIIE